MSDKEEDGKSFWWRVGWNIAKFQDRWKGEDRMLTPHETKKRHVELHHYFDELFACFVEQNPNRYGRYTEATIKEFMEWSYQMTKKPTCVEKK